MISIRKWEAPLGTLFMAAEEDNLLGLWIEGQTYFPSALLENARENAEHPILKQTEEWLKRYFEGEKPKIDELKLKPQGSSFAQEVWEILCTIAYGKTMTYGAIVQQLAIKRGLKRMSAQGVGGAVGHNPISIIIPCHRVIGSNGNLTGYAGGLDKKIYLLTHEGVSMEQFYIPKKKTVR